MKNLFLLAAITLAPVALFAETDFYTGPIQDIRAQVPIVDQNGNSSKYNAIIRTRPFTTAACREADQKLYFDTTNPMHKDMWALAMLAFATNKNVAIQFKPESTSATACIITDISIAKTP